MSELCRIVYKFGHVHRSGLKVNWKLSISAGCYILQIFYKYA